MADDMVVRQLYESIGLSRDGLPYTLEFDSFHKGLCGAIHRSLTKHEGWRLLCTVLKKGGAHGMKRGSRAPSLRTEGKQMLRNIMPGPVSERDRWPYTAEFENACDDFNDLTAGSFSPHQIWRAVCNLGKQGGGTAGPSAQRFLVAATREYAEGRRVSRERRFFARNLTLVRRAKEKYGFRCQVCGFAFERMYGALGAGYIECHHLNPLSERPEAQWSAEIGTNIEDVRVLCANCHRMVHRQRPALSVEELKRAMRRS